MKKKIFILSTFLVLMAIGCQKEKDNAFDGKPLTETSARESGLISYTIDGIAYRTAVQDVATNATLLQQLMILAQNGHQVSLY